MENETINNGAQVQSTEKKSKKKKVVVIIIIALVLAAVIAVGAFFGIPYLNKKNTYKTALDFYNKGDLLAAMELFESLGDFSDSKEFLEKIQNTSFDEITDPDFYSMDDVYDEEYPFEEYVPDSEEYSAEEDFEVEDSPNLLAYNEALILMKNKEYGKAAIAFGKLGDYGDAVSKSFECWNYVPYIRRTADMDSYMCRYIRKGGSVFSEGSDYGIAGSMTNDTFMWSEKVISICGNRMNSFGLKENGTVYVLGESDISDGFDPYSVQNWTNIVSIVCNGYDMVIGIRNDGTVCAISSEDYTEIKESIETWTDIIGISAYYDNIIGLKADGTAVAYSEDSGTSDVYKWSGIKGVIALSYGFLGLKNDGSVVGAGVEYDFSSFKNIVDIASTYEYGFIGLKSDGTLVHTGGRDYEYLIPAIKNYKDIDSIISIFNTVIYVKKDGTKLYSCKDKELSEYEKMYLSANDVKTSKYDMMYSY